MNWEAVTKALTDTMRGAELSAKLTDDPMRKLEAQIVSGVAASLANAIQRGLDETADLPATDAQAMQNEKVKALVEALEWYESRRLEAIVRAKAIHATEDAAVLALCRKHGFGAVIDSACRQWANMPEGGRGAFFVGGCIADKTADAALAAIKEGQDDEKSA